MNYSHPTTGSAAAESPGLRRSHFWGGSILAGSLCLGLLAVFLYVRGSGTRADANDDAGDALDQLQRMSLVFSPGGSGESPASYFIDRYEVTNREYRLFMSDAGQSGSSDLDQMDRLGRISSAEMFHPIVEVSLQDALEYSEWAGKQLPTEEEWERVAREASGDSRFFVNAYETDIEGTSRVGSFESGSTGRSWIVQPEVYDLYGNVWEWTGSSVSSDDGQSLQVVKGGSFLNRVAEMHPWNAAYERAEVQDAALGFRCIVRDADKVIRNLLLLSMESTPRVQARIDQTLIGFGEPLRRLVEWQRFREATRYRLDDRADQDHVFPLSNGRVCLVGYEGTVQLCEGKTGQLLGVLTDLGDVEQAAVADLDGDGVEELYLLTRGQSHYWSDAVSDIPGFEPDAVVPEHLVVRRGDGSSRIIDGTTGTVLPFSEWEVPEKREEVIRKAFDVFWFGQEGYGIPGVPLMASDPDRLGWVNGFVPRDRLELVRVDLDAFNPGVLWIREVLPSPSIQLLPGSGEILLAGEMVRRFGFGPDRPEVFNRVLKLTWQDAATGEASASALIPGGCAVLQALDERGRNVLVVTQTGHELVVHRTDSGQARIRMLRDTVAPYFVEGLAPGPGHTGALLLVVFLDAVGRPTGGQLEKLDQHGHVETVVNFPLDDHSVPRLESLPGASVVLLWASDQVRLLDTDLEEQWSHPAPGGIDIERVGSVAFRDPRTGHFRIAMANNRDGILIVDARHGEVLDELYLPEGVLTGLSVLHDGNEDLLFATFRDQGLYAIEMVDSRLDREARRVLTSRATGERLP